MLPANYPFRAAPEEIHAPPTTIDGPEAYLESSRAQRLLDDAHGVPSRKVHVSCRRIFLTADIYIGFTVTVALLRASRVCSVHHLTLVLAAA